jgi:hypothetical protein
LFDCFGEQLEAMILNVKGPSSFSAQREPGYPLGTLCNLLTLPQLQCYRGNVLIMFLHKEQIQSITTKNLNAHLQIRLIEASKIKLKTSIQYTMSLTVLVTPDIEFSDKHLA